MHELSSAAPILQVKNLKKYFHTPRGELHAVDDVSFEIQPGKTLGVVGESGCGKTTTGRAILRLIEPTSGSILFDGLNITTMDKRRLRMIREKMQIIFQDPYSSLDPRMTVSGIIAEPLIIHRRVSGKKELERRVQKLMEMVELEDRLYSAYPHELDGGRRQRIGIARALALEPKFIVCDEPVSSLDVSVQAQILNLMQDLQDQLNLTYMFVTHDMAVVKHISNEIAVMYLGQIIEKAPAKELFKHQYHPYSRALISAIPKIESAGSDTVTILRGEIGSPIEPKPGCRFAPRCEYCIEKCLSENPPPKAVGPERFAACWRAEEI
ncbi:MAG: ABC transporter ATP-binding protein [Rectinema sp.]